MLPEWRLTDNCYSTYASRIKRYTCVTFESSEKLKLQQDLMAKAQRVPRKFEPNWTRLIDDLYFPIVSSNCGFWKTFIGSFNNSYFWKLNGNGYIKCNLLNMNM